MQRYKRIKIKGKMVMEHRYVWEQVNGPIPIGYEMHHINRKTQDNRIDNLQLRAISDHRRYHHIKKGVCCIPDCNLPHEAKGYCKKHWFRILRTGSPFGLRGHSSTNPLCII
jgi:hypothetical protein